MLNQLILTGNLGKDPDTFFTGDGQPIAKFSLAFKSGKDKTGWINVVCFKRLAEIAGKCLHKGARIAIIGTLQQSKWESDEGVQKSSFELIANTLEFIKTDGRGFGDNQHPDGADDIPF
jgi:single-strand DNA-binding protein